MSKKPSFTFTKYHGQSKAGKDYDAYKLSVGKFSRLIFVNDPIVRDYLDSFISDSSHEDFQNGDDSLFD